MRYIIYVFGLIAAIAVCGRASPLAAWGWRVEDPTPAPSPTRPSKQEKKEEPHPLVGKWLDTKRLRLIELRATGELIDSGFPTGGLTWMPIVLKTEPVRDDLGRIGAKPGKAKVAVWGSLRVAEISFRADYGTTDVDLLGDGRSSPGDPFICGFQLARAQAGCAGLEGLDADSAKKPDRMCLRLCRKRGEPGGEYERVKADPGTRDVTFFDTWVETASGKVIEFTVDAKLVAHNAADGYLLPGEWGKIPQQPKADAANDEENEVDDDEAGAPFGEKWTLRVVEEGALVVRVGGSMVSEGRILLCRYRIGFAFDTTQAYDKDEDVDAIKLWRCRTSWTQDEDYKSQEKGRRDAKPGSRIVRLLSGERMDVSRLSAETVVLRGLNRR